MTLKTNIIWRFTAGLYEKTLWTNWSEVSPLTSTCVLLSWGTSFRYRWPTSRIYASADQQYCSQQFPLHWWRDPSCSSSQCDGGWKEYLLLCGGYAHNIQCVWWSSSFFWCCCRLSTSRVGKDMANSLRCARFRFTAEAHLRLPWPIP